MKKQITDNRFHYKSFELVDIGECFTDNKELYIKTPRLFDDNHRSCNAVSIDTGTFHYFDNEHMIMSIKNLTIEIS